MGSLIVYLFTKIVNNNFEGTKVLCFNMFICKIDFPSKVTIRTIHINYIKKKVTTFSKPFPSKSSL